MKRIILLIPLLLLSIIGPGVLQTDAQGSSNASWKVEYFNNPYLIGPAVATQQHNRLAFDWGIGAPAANVPADKFSARITTDVYFPSGTYRFYMVNDDRAHLYVDFQSKINNWDNNQVGQLRTVDITLSAGTYHIQVDYREEEGAAYVFLDWESTADGIQGPSFQIPGSVVGGNWTAEYFTNTNLSGPAFAVRGETTPAHNWAFGAPIAGMPVDNFSARWTSSQTFDGGTYTISVRADDGVRVFVDNIQYINQWGLATGQTYTATISPTRGNHLVRVEFFEAGEIAFLEFSLTANARPPTAPTGAYIVVDTGRLNVRNMPTLNGSIVLTKIDFGQVYPIVGVNGDGTWWQINVNGTRGWVSAPYVDAFNTQNVPITDGSGTAPVVLPVTGYRVTTIANLNIRSGPSAAASRIGLIPVFETAAVIGRNTSATWWYVEYQGIRGWVSAAYAPIQSGANVLTIPILG
jgi:uncharacterized protein YraI